MEGKVGKKCRRKNFGLKTYFFFGTVDNSKIFFMSKASSTQHSSFGTSMQLF